MKTRRRFLQTSAAAAVVSQTVLGANDRVQMGIIGTGNRGTQVYEGFTTNRDVTFVAACEVAQDRLERFTTAAGVKMETYTDYRRMLENKDIDAVLISTPDHWHAPMTVDACAAGKDIYVEKPVSNTIDGAVQMLDAVRLSDRVVQVGCQQRSWDHFQECAKKIQDGYMGEINHCVMLLEGRWREAYPQEPEPVPLGLDWDMWQGPAQRHAYRESRQRSWRRYFDYGGGTITDWGVHLTDVALWFMEADRKAPLLTSAAAQYVSVQPPDLERAPDTFSVAWKYDRWVGTFTNAVLPSPDPEMTRSDLYGNYFYGEKGILLVNRYGYQVWPVRQDEAAAQAAAAVQADRSMAKSYTITEATARHTRNFLDCVKSRQQPVCDMDTGFNSTLPTLLAVMAIRHECAFKWDGRRAIPA